MNMYGYCRVSTFEQNADRQIAAMTALNISNENIYVEKISGKDFNRTIYQSLLKKMKPGDLLYIKSIDRLGRNYDEIQQQWRNLTKERGIDIAVIDMPLLDTRRDRDLMGTFLSDIVLQVLSFVAQNERDDIRKRQKEGIAAAKAKGTSFGRPTIKPPEDFPNVIKQWECGKIEISEALELTGLKVATFYNRLREYRNEQKT